MTAASKVTVLTLATLGKGFKQVKNALTGFVDLFLSADANNSLGFGSDGGLFANVPGLASATANGTIPKTQGVASGSLLQALAGAPAWVATVASGGSAAQAGAVGVLNQYGQYDRSMLPGGVTGWSNTDTGSAWSNTGS